MKMVEKQVICQIKQNSMLKINNLKLSQAQYNFIYEALIEEAKLGPTCFSKDEFTKFYKTLKDGFLESIERSHMLYQHQVLISTH